MNEKTTQAGAESYPPGCSPEEYRNNILEGVALWLNGRSQTVWAKEFGHTGLMQAWAEDLRKIAAALRARGAVPSGWVLVPKHVTNNMIDAANDTPAGIGGSPPHWQHVWDQLLGAAPEYKEMS